MGKEYACESLILMSQVKKNPDYESNMQAIKLDFKPLQYL